MRNLDPEKERGRLAQYYSTLADEEIERLAETSASLTDIARDTLRREASCRRLEIQISATPEIPEHAAEEPKLVIIQSFRDLPEALFAKGSLESAGIECVLNDDNFVRLDWFISNAIGGVKLLVKKEDAEVALEILHEGVPETIDLGGAGEYKQPSCPECHALDISLCELDRPAAYLTSILADIPYRPHSDRWKCNACGIEWDPDPHQE